MIQLEALFQKFFQFGGGWIRWAEACVILVWIVTKIDKFLEKVQQAFDQNVNSEY